MFSNFLLPSSPCIHHSDLCPSNSPKTVSLDPIHDLALYIPALLTVMSMRSLQVSSEPADLEKLGISAVVRDRLHGYDLSNCISCSKEIACYGGHSDVFKSTLSNQNGIRVTRTTVAVKRLRFYLEVDMRKVSA